MTRCSNPTSFHADLHTTKFPDGAARAQFHQLNHTVATSGVLRFRSRSCWAARSMPAPPQLDGSFAFTQHDLDAHLNGLIHHTFVQPLAGVPQWQAPDGSAVTGKLVTKNATGDGNIAELNLDATQIGTSTGLLAHGVEVLRLNTVGGVAPASTCDPQATPIVNVSYQADTPSSTASNVERLATPVTGNGTAPTA